MARLTAAVSWDCDVRGGRGGGVSLLLVEEPDGAAGSCPKERPVIKELTRRTVKDRQRMTRDTRAGRLCHVRAMVPKVRMIRREVRMYNGGRVRTIQRGVTKRIRMKSVVSAGRVVADVAVRCVERKSVSNRKGSSNMLQRSVKLRSVSTISSRLL